MSGGVERRSCNRDLANIVVDLLRIGAKEVYEISYPKGERAVDYVTVMSEDKVLVKVSKRLSSKSRSFQELKSLSRDLSVNAVIVAEKFNNENLIEDVMLIRNRIGIIARRTLSSLAKGGKVLVYEFNGRYYIKVQGSALRELRLRRNLSVYELATMVGVSPKTLRKYEESEIDMSVEKAFKFIEIFGDDFENVVREVDVFRDRIVVIKDNRGGVSEGEGLGLRKNLTPIINKLKKLGAESANPYSLIPPDIIAQIRGLRVFISYIDHSLDLEDVEGKCRYNKMLSKLFNGVAVAVLNNGSVNQDVISIAENFNEVSKLSELDQFVESLITEARR